MNAKFSARLCATALVALTPAAALAQLTIQDNFTGATSSFNWQTFNGACLTAGNNTGNIPACFGLAYYGGQQLVGGTSGLLPDAAGSGALRFTNGRPGGYNQSGAIVSNFTFPTGQGLHVTFATATYRGDSGGAGGDGADGISFYLMDGAQPAGIGAFGGSLAYTCSNANTPHDGLVGGYLGLGIDEFGNFLNGQTLEPGYAGTNVATGDNTALGYGYHPGRIGLRGAGSVAWAALHALNGAFYPATLSAANQQAAVQSTCRSGFLWNYSDATNPVQTATAIADYAPILNAYKELPSGFLIANEGALTRGAATPITYDLKITPAGLLSLSYSYNGGASQLVINGQDITASNGALPATFRFGFAGSTGGDTNIHEILCFKATPFEQSSSSAGLNQQQAAQVNTGTQVYLAFFDPSNWSGSLTSQNVLYNSSTQTVSISAVANWDASCVLTGVPAGQKCFSTGVSGATAAEAPTSRQILTWNGTHGIPFEWASLTSAQQTTLDAGDPNPINANRLNYLRGVRTNEQNALGIGLFGSRVSILSDIIDSSPTPVGPPNQPYPTRWADALISSPNLPENSGQSYTSYALAQQSRLNVVYVGANDGYLHGFRAGSFDSNGNFVSGGSTPNDGYEVLAYMPGAVVNTIHNPTDPALDFSNIQYGHAFFEDATPGNGDLFYGGLWHTWVVGGLGPGGSAIFALDVTNPSSSSFTEANAASIVIGEWNPTTLTCINAGGCGNNLGNTYGTPQIVRFHNGMWGAVFGNGYGSSSGDAGIFVMTVDPTSAARTFYYFSTGQGGSNDGIAYAAPLDIDGDHIVDYVYAGDLLGNIWRFDFTSSNPAQWALSTPAPLFKTPGGQPITTQVVPLFTFQTNSLPRVMVDFGTGRQIPLTNSSPTTYATGGQSLYGIWDWNMSSWNSKSQQQVASLPAPQSVTLASLSAQAVLSTVTSAGGNQFRTISSNPVCWSGSTTCTSSTNNQFGWVLPLPSASEQVIFNPTLQLGVFLVNSTIPPTNSPFQCVATTTTGWTYGISPSNGGTFANSTFGDSVNSFVTYNNQVVGAENTNGTGSTSVVLAGGHSFLVMQTSAPGSSGGTSSGGSSGSSSGSTPPGGAGAATPFNGPNPRSSRVTWAEKR
ncbi:MAG TPA: PilC/PilY family type IV pilus protein [Steroidobacteraceae bacterium]|jgi:type IV pilus assembly protein PilY1|nr:PilC/PilY family type IV pilus protein [Steroidobacteraceae bacterium]